MLGTGSWSIIETVRIYHSQWLVGCVPDLQEKTRTARLSRHKAISKHKRRCAPTFNKDLYSFCSLFTQALLAIPIRKFSGHLLDVSC
jgi:hypothetical protein